MRYEIVVVVFKCSPCIIAFTFKETKPFSNGFSQQAYPSSGSQAGRSLSQHAPGRPWSPVTSLDEHIHTHIHIYGQYGKLSLSYCDTANHSTTVVSQRKTEIQKNPKIPNIYHVAVTQVSRHCKLSEHL